MTEDILFDLADGVATITFNRPEQFNSFSAAMMGGLGEAYRRCDVDDDIRAVVVTGAGSAFCAGADMAGGGSTFDTPEQPDFSSCPLSFQAWDVRKPVIAACNGHAVGVGLGIAVQCDVRLFADEGKYGFLQVRRGVVADFAAHHVLPRLVGLETALELILSGRRLTGAEAKALGLCSRVLPAAEVLPAALELAHDMAAHCSPLPVALAKRMIWSGLDRPLDAMAALETRALHYTMGRPDAIEGGLAFFEKRAPAWRSRVTEEWPEWMPGPAGPMPG